MVIMFFRPNSLNFLTIATKLSRKCQAKKSQKSINFNKLSKIDFYDFIMMAAKKNEVA